MDTLFVAVADFDILRNRLKKIKNQTHKVRSIFHKNRARDRNVVYELDPYSLVRDAYRRMRACAEIS
jgi:hypothetical protein